MGGRAEGPAISVPEGGGAVRGIGEKFSPDLFTGTGNLSVPLDLPPGRNGFQPTLSLDYSTGNGNGPCGLGFALAIPSITRKTHPVPRGDASDIFILSGSEDLVPVAANGARQEYRPRTEGLFARIARVSGAADHWEVATKDGWVSTYGDDAAGGMSTVADPDDPTNPQRIFEWKLSQTRDPFGNLITYEYRRDRMQAQARHWDQNYIKRIRYADYDVGNGTQFLVSLEFYYDDEDLPHAVSTPVRARPDPFSEYRAGFEIRTRRRCCLILVRSHPAGSQAVPMRAYRLVYLDERVDLTPAERALPANGTSLLSRIEVFGYDDAGVPGGALPPIDFGYTAFDPAKRSFRSVHTGAEPGLSLAEPTVDLVDIHGGGLPDLVSIDGAVRFCRNLGAGRFASARTMHDSPLGLSLSDPGVQLLDVNGDGRADLVVNDAQVSTSFTLEFGARWTQRPSQGRQSPSFDRADPEVRFLDLDGDGVTDALRTGERIECFFQDEKKGWNRIRTLTRRPLAEFPDVSFSDARVKLASLAGSGLDDIALVHASSLSYWPNLGHGNWGARLTMPIQPALPDDFDPARVLLGDVDGDGYADLVLVEADRVLVWFSQSGNAFSAQPVEIRGVPPVADGDALRVVDLYGCGVAGILWSAGPGNPARQRTSFLDLSGGVKPYLLERTANNLGATTIVQYASSTKYFLEDDTCSRTRWKTPLPFPVQVVARVEVIDHLSGGKHTTEYQYRGGYWDGPEKEFRGFAEVRAYSSEGFADYNGAGLHGAGAAFKGVPTQYFSPPTLLKTFFHQGPVGDEHGAWEDVDRSSDHWPGDPSRFDAKGAVDGFLRSYCTAVNPHARRDMRDALRSLRGNVLRTELYALDGSASQDLPYTVTEHAYQVREESPPGPHEVDRKRIFFPHPVAMRTTQWERGDDPLTEFAFTGDHDAFGNACRQVAVACPRGWRTMADRPPGGFLATVTATVYASPAPGGPYIHDRAARVRAHEVTSTSGKTVAEVADTPLAAATLRLIAESLHFYDGDATVAGNGAFTGLAHGELGRFGALVRTETLCMTDTQLAAAYGPQVPPYLTQQAPIPASTDHPAAFVALLPARAGYVFRAGGAASPHSRGYFVVSASRQYDFHVTPGTGRGLLLAQRDPLGNDTAIGYDAHGLFPTSTSGPREANAQPLVVSATYDYRVMQPASIADPNGNVTVVAFTPDGLVSAISVQGRAGSNQGDQLQAGVRFEYGLRAYFDSVRADPTQARPAYARTLRRVHHDTDPDDSGETLESVEYSDGFGRLLQTRAQADSVHFGDAHFGGGGAVLGGDAAASAMAVVSGVENSSAIRPNVKVSGAQRYDNKGRVVERWEPYLDTGLDHAAPGSAKLGQKVSLYFDPRGMAVRTVNPDGSEQRVVYGVPVDMADPPLSPLDTAKFTPTPWEMWTYDANDNAGRTHATAAAGYQHHWNTPASIETDALGRTLSATVRHRLPGQPVEEHVTRSSYDIQGHLVRIRDPLGRVAFEWVHNLLGQPLRVASMDTGISTMVIDAGGSLVETRDARGALVLHAYDSLRRPVRVWARDSAGESVTLRQKLVYGDSPAAPQSAADNRLGRLFRHYDEAGLAETASYDFKGNVLSSSRRVLSDAFMLSVIDDPARIGWSLPAPRVDWDATAPPELDAAVHATRTAYDALCRIKWSEYPDCANGERYRLVPAYDRAAALKSVSIAGPLDAGDNGPLQTYVERMVHNARGQCVLIAYGNGVMTRYAYDALTFRLVRLRSERCARQGALAYLPLPGVLQDLAYEHDLAGNVLSTLDRTPGCGVRGNAPAAVSDPALRQRMADGNALLRRFEYDPLYRLVHASGREAALVPTPRPWHELSAAGSDVVSGVYVAATPPATTQDNAPDLTALYEERYDYDPAGNLLELAHARGGATVWSRHFGMAGLTPRQWRQNVADFASGMTPAWGTGGNRMTHRGNDDLQATATHTYDAAGNLVGENSERRFEWDHAGKLKAFRIQAGSGQPSRYALYLYDATGMRAKKLVWDSPGNYRTTTCVGGAFEHHRRVTPGDSRQNNSLHVMEGDLRVAIARVGAALDTGASAPAIQYHHGDHLGSSALVLSEDATWINREEYFPHGETSFGSFGRKRYRFTGKERDEESGLGYHGARYYAHACMRWVSADPLGPQDGLNLYAYVGANPLRYADPSGLSKEPGSEGGGAPPTICDEPTYDVEAGRPIIHIHLSDNVVHMARPPAEDSAAPGSAGTATAPEGAPEDSSSALPDVGQAGTVVTAAGLYLASMTDYVSKTSVIWSGNIAGRKAVWDAAGGTALAGAEWLRRTRGFQHLESTVLGRMSYAVSNAAIRVFGNAARPVLYQTVWRAVSAVYGFRAGVSGHALMRLIQTSMKKLPNYGLGNLFRLEARAYQVGRAVRGLGRTVGGRLPLIGGLISVAGLAQDIQSGDVASGVGNALNVASSVAAVVGATAAAKVLVAGALGYAVGSLINEYIAEPLIDRAAPGSGALGDWYYRTFLK